MSDVTPKWQKDSRVRFREDGATGRVEDVWEYLDPDTDATLREPSYDVTWHDNGETTFHSESELGDPE
jgi:hypothetical protein